MSSRKRSGQRARNGASRRTEVAPPRPDRSPSRSAPRSTPAPNGKANQAPRPRRNQPELVSPGAAELVARDHSWPAIVRELRQWPGLPVVLLALFAGAFFRFYNLTWDGVHSFHPDENNLVAAATRIQFFGKMDPEFFAYGGFTIYLYRAIGGFIGWLARNPEWASDWNRVALIGRFLSAAFSLLTTVPLYLAARRLFDFRIAALSAVFFLFCVSSIQTAHYGVTESLLTLAVAALCPLSLRLLERPTLGTYLQIALVFGIALAAKISAAFFAVIPFAAFALLLWRERPRVGRHLAFAVLAGVVALLCVALFSPYTFLKWQEFRDTMQFEGGVVRGTAPVFWTLQFDGTTPFLFWLANLPWLMGLVAPFCVAGLLWLFVGLLMRRVQRPQEVAVFLSFPVLYVLYIGPLHAKFLRYLVPLLPFLCIGGGLLLGVIARRWKTPGRALAGFIAGATVLWALAFFSIYRTEQTRFAASRWVFANVPPRSVILTEGNDVALPVGVENGDPGIYQIRVLSIYDDNHDESDNPEKPAYYAQNLAEGDYLILASRRLYGTLPRLTSKYPLTGRYYRLLFAGKLGYERVGEFTSYPRLFGVSIPDDTSEETFQVFDHPKVTIFRNVKRLSQAEFSRLLNEESGNSLPLPAP